MDAARRAAESVLNSNWIGTSTKPSARLYPHQWSWDSAFIAMGNAALGRSDRAVLELETLFAAQWSNGMVPHMVFDQTATDYHPSPEVWGTLGHPCAPAATLTSGMCQPAVHALAVCRIARSLPPSEACAFLERMFPKLVAWHDHLHETRAIGSPLLEIWHPWESGMDNSPLWDVALARLDPPDEEIPEYERVDTKHAPAGERPTTSDYDRYMWLVAVLREHGWRPSSPETLPFRVCDVLFNTIAAFADRELAVIARSIGIDGDRFEERSLALGRAIAEELWSEPLGMFVNLDRGDGSKRQVRAAGGLSPLLLPLEPRLRSVLLETLHTRFLTTLPGGGSNTVVPTVAPDDATFEPGRYWRGPVWVNVTWLLIRALEAQPDTVPLASTLSDGIVGAVAAAGCNEYFHASSGAPLGAADFSWTAALTIDLVTSPPGRGGGPDT